jgi:DNA-binding NarL/FixJ family response regulator
MRTTDVQARRTVPNGLGAVAALIAPEESRDAIAAVLDVEGLGITAFDRVEDVPDAGVRNAPSVAVLWAQDTSPSSLAPLLRSLTQLLDRTPVVVVCAGIQRWGIRAALTAGAAGVVLYGDLDSALGPCLQAVQTGQICVPREHWQQIEPPPLSSREKQILGLVVMGYMNSQIAEQLFLAESTVKSHLSSAFGKLGVRSRNEAAHLILDPGRGLGMGILALGGEPLETVPATVQ